MEMAMTREKRECIALLINARRMARTAIADIDRLVFEQRQSRRRTRQYRLSGNPILMRNAEVIEARLKENGPEIERLDQLLVFIGKTIRLFEDDIDRLLTNRELLDLLEVNPVDRNRISPTAGISEIVFIHGLEDSASNRGEDFKNGPLAKALISYMNDIMVSNPELQQKMTAGLFGKGGMFEFVSTYQKLADGRFIRNRPKLRLAEASIDVK